MGDNTHERVVSLLNNAQQATAGDEALNQLKQAKELIIHVNPDLLDNFLDEILAFMINPSPDVRKFVLGFIQEACEKDNEILPKVIPNLHYMITKDDNHNVQKKIIQTISHLYPLALKWMASCKQPTNDMESSWSQLCTLKSRIVPLIDGENDGIRTHAIKFVEKVVLTLSLRTDHSELKKDGNLSLDIVPRDHRSLNFEQLEADGRDMLQQLISLIALDHITATNLQTTMGALTNIARQRPEIGMEKAIRALETLHVNLPPTLARSQVSSVRKMLKLHLLTILKHPYSTPFQDVITTLLTDLGATQAQINKSLPPSNSSNNNGSNNNNNGDSRKRGQKSDNGNNGSSGIKQPKLDPDEYGDGDGEGGVGGDGGGQRKEKNAVEITADYLYPVLSVTNVADLVLLTMVQLPDQMPPAFQSSYTPIGAAGTEAQIKHLCRLMSTQLTNAGLGPGIEAERKEEERRKREEAEKRNKPPSAAYDNSQASSSRVGAEDSKYTTGGTGSKSGGVGSSGAQSSSASAAAGSSAANSLSKIQNANPMYGVSTGGKASKRFQTMGLVHMTKPMDPDMVLTMLNQAFQRIIAAEKRAIQGGKTVAQQSLLIRLASRFDNLKLQEQLLGYIMADQKTRADLAVTWIYETYCSYKGFLSGGAAEDSEQVIKGMERYDRCLCTMLSILLSKGEHKESLFHKLVLEAPHITPNALELVKQACMDPVHGQFCLTTLKEMIITRPKQRSELLFALLDFTFFEQIQFRTEALNIAKGLHGNPFIASDIKKFVSQSQLRLLLEQTPPDILFGADRGREENPGKWTEQATKACLYLYLHLLPLDHSLIHDLAHVYTETVPDIKRVILRQLELPVKAMGIDSPQLLMLVEHCPEGSETLVTRVVHLLTERNPPTAALVAKVRNLYTARVPDVRCLIPVLTGLTKAEIMAALPKLVRLNPNVVKEVFNRLLFGKSLDSSAPPMSPVELLTTLHTMQAETDGNKEDLKYIVAAMNIVIQMRSVYSKEVLASVIQQLVDISVPPPMLIMRTMIQSLTIFPALLGFIINVLQRMVTMQIWIWPNLWEGFVKCCQKSVPHSFTVLLNLPPAQLKHLFTMAPDMQQPLIDHIQSLSSQQKASISNPIMDVVMKVDLPPMTDQQHFLAPGQHLPPPQQQHQQPRQTVTKSSSATDISLSINPPGID